MQPNLSQQELLALTNLPAEKRGEYLVKRITDHKFLIGLRNPQGWVTAASPNGEGIPIWSHASYAELCATGEWVDCKPTQIPLKDWLENWIPKLKKDKKLIFGFPTPKDKGISMSPDQFQGLIAQELNNYEQDHLEPE